MKMISRSGKKETDYRMCVEDLICQKIYIKYFCDMIFDVHTVNINKNVCLKYQLL